MDITFPVLLLLVAVVGVLVFRFCGPGPNHCPKCKAYHAAQANKRK